MFSPAWTLTTLSVPAFSSASAENRRDLTTGGAVVSPEIDEHRQLALDHFPLERVIGDVRDLCHRYPPNVFRMRAIASSTFARSLKAEMRT
jgi:hypothetical protein